MERKCLDICISTYNRGSIVCENIKNIFLSQSDQFRVIVQNDCSTDYTLELLHSINDNRLIVINNKESNAAKYGVMYNWYKVLTYAKSYFVLYVNDRDIINYKELDKLIQFLLIHKSYAGGVCHSVFKTKVFLKEEDSFVHIPYYGYHPSGMVYNVEYLNRIENLKNIFTKEFSGMHPHDIVLAELCKYGSMFLYSKYVWEMADTNSFLKNKSFLFNETKKIESFWFHPYERMKEYKLFISHMCKMGFSEKSIKKRAIRTSKRYLFYCTLNYKNFVSDKGQVSHYGIDPIDINRENLNDLRDYFMKESYEKMRVEGILINKSAYEAQMYIYFIAIYYGLGVWHIVKKIMNKLH